MPTYNGQATAKGEAFTNTDPKSLVTSSATATATSTVSQNDADELAKNTAQNVANSVAQNDANIITQMVDITTTNVKGKFSNLNTYYATPTDIGTNSTFTGIITTPAVFNTSSINITYLKPVYEINSLSTTQPNPTKIIKDAYIKGAYNLTFENFVPPKPLPPNAPPGTKSLLTGTRFSYIYIPISSNKYNNTVVTNVTIFCSIYIDEATTINDLNGSFLNLIINNKMAQNVSVYESNLFNSFSGVVMNESYASNNKFNYFYLNFDNASLAGSSANIYPYTVGAIAP
jgi:hypothetical protein